MPAVVALCGLVVAYLHLCYLGTLLMRLVLVQVVEARSARYGFATSFATAVSLFILVLAHAAANTRVTPFFSSALAQRLFPVSGQPSSARGDGGNNSSNAAGASDAPGEAAVMGGGTAADSLLAWRTAWGGEGAIVVLFRALLTALVGQILVVSPAILAYLVLANRMAMRRRRRQQAERGRAAAKQLEMAGDPYGRTKRAQRSPLARCCPSGWGVRMACGMLLLLLLGCAGLLLLRMSQTVMSGFPLVHGLARTAADFVLRGLRALLTRLTMPPEVPARNMPSPPPAAFDGVSEEAGVAHGRAGRDPAAAAAALAAAALARVTSPTLRWAYHVTEVLTARVGTLGVAIMGLLGGYAAVTSPYNYLVSYFYYRKREDVLMHAQQQLSRKQRYALSLCAAKMRRLAKESHESRSRLAPAQEDLLYDKVNAHNEQHNRSAVGPTKPGRRWLGGVFAKAKGSVASVAASTRAKLSAAVGSGGVGGRWTSAKERQQLRVEAAHARNLSLFLFLKMDEIGYMLREARRGKTWVGRLMALCGLLLAAYSVVKFALTVASLYLFRVSTQDPVTRALTFMEHYGVLPPQQSNDADAVDGFSLTAIQISAQLVMALALLVNAWMVVTSIRGLLLTIFQLTLSFTTLVTADTTAVMFSVFMAVYFVGQLVMLRQSLPAPTASAGGAQDADGPADSANVLFVVLGTLPLHFYQRLNDWCFVVGCVATMVARRWLLSDPCKGTVSVANG